MSPDPSKLKALLTGLILVSGLFATTGFIYSLYRQKVAADLADREINLAQRFIAGLIERPLSCYRLLNGTSQSRTFAPASNDPAAARLNIPYVIAAPTRAREAEYLAYDLSKGPVGLPETGPLVFLRSVELQAGKDAKPGRMEIEGLVYETWNSHIVLQFEHQWPSPHEVESRIPLIVLTEPDKHGIAGCLPSSEEPTCSLNDDECVAGGTNPCTEVSDGGLNCPALPDSSCRPYFYSIVDQKTGRSECNCAWRCEDPRKKQLSRERREINNRQNQEPHPPTK